MKKGLTKQEEAALNFSFYPYLYRLSEEVKRREILNFLKGAQKGADLGCGNGWLSAYLAKEGLEMEAVDLSTTSLKTARFLFKKEGLKIPLIKASILKLPFPNNYFDFVVLCEVLEHVPQPEKALREIYRCLKKNGKFCLSIPNSWTFGLIYDRFLLRLFTNSSKQGGGANAKMGSGKETAEALKKLGIISSMEGFGHINQFSIFSIRKVLTSVGFRIVKIINLELFFPYFNTLFSGVFKINKQRLKILGAIDQKIARFSPHFLAANWLIFCQKCD